MRTLRLSLAGTVILALLGGLSVVAVAQSDELPVVVTGSPACAWKTDWPTALDPDGVRRMRNVRGDCISPMSDLRLRGMYLTTLNRDCYLETECIYWGTSVLDKAEGGWDCSFVGTEDPYGTRLSEALVLSVCQGTGGYEGLTFVSQQAADPEIQFEHGGTVNGLLYEGDPPPWGPLSELPAQ